MGKIAFVFPGQGAQVVGMGQNVYENSAVAKDVFEQAKDKRFLSKQNGCNLYDSGAKVS